MSWIRPRLTRFNIPRHGPPQTRARLLRRRLTRLKFRWSGGLPVNVVNDAIGFWNQQHLLVTIPRLTPCVDLRLSPDGQKYSARPLRGHTCGPVFLTHIPACAYRGRFQGFCFRYNNLILVEEEPTNGLSPPVRRFRALVTSGLRLRQTTGAVACPGGHLHRGLPHFADFIVGIKKTHVSHFSYDPLLQPRAQSWRAASRSK